MNKEQKLAVWKQVLDDEYGIDADEFSVKEIKVIISVLKAVLEERKL